MLGITFSQLWGIPLLKISTQSDVVYPGVIAPRHPPKMDSIVSWTNSEYLKAETLCPESIDGLDGPIVGYLRIYDDSWFVSREQFRPNFGSKNVFAVIFLEPGNFDIWYS